MRALTVVAVLVALAPIATLAQAPPPPPRAEGYERLAPIVGRWTLKGREGRFIERCDWYEGRFHVVCHTESTRADGTKARSMSILGYLPGEDVYTYHGIGGRGRNETLRGTLRNGVFEFVGESRDRGRVVKTRTRLGPFDGREFPIATERDEGEGWKPAGEERYVRLD